MVEIIGFKKKPFSQILWEMEGEVRSKTVCYTIEDELSALARFYDTTDFYNHYDKAIVFRNENNQFELSRREPYGNAV